jgi:hypothetical protein
MRAYYSRLQSTEEKNNLKRAGLFIFLTIASVLLLIFVGIPLFGRVAIFFSDLKSGGKAITKTDTTPPPPPSFNNFSIFTNQTDFVLSGNAESGANVKLTFNGVQKDALANKDGAFTFNLQLGNGANSFSAISIDEAGNQSQKTQNFEITFDNKPPALTVDSPTDGDSFFGSNQRQVTIQGTTDPETQIVINDRFVTVDDQGIFQYTTTLNDGANAFSVKAADRAGNSSEKTITLNFSP